MASQPHGAGTQGGAAGFHDPGDGPTRMANCIIRFVALVAAFIAAVVMGVAKQTKSILTTSGDAIGYRFRAAGTPQFDYFIAVNAIACFYSAASLAVWMAAKGWPKNLALALAVVDLVMVVFLFSGEGSAAAMGVLLRRGDGDVYPRVCSVYADFCGRVTAAIVMSMFAAVAYFALVVISHLNLYRRSL